MFAKREKYFYDWCAISEPMKENSLKRLAQNVEEQVGSTRANGGEKTNGTMKAVCFGGNKKSGGQSRLQSGNEWNQQGTRANKRDVWSIAPAGYKGAHFAVMPEKLAETCILASSRPGGIVFDPFFGSGTTGSVAIEHGRRFIGCELNRDYKPLQDERIRLAWESRHTADMNSAQLDLAGV
jgi:site-specific DNA-methyltransferase (cytosine-N4-specific)